MTSRTGPISSKFAHLRFIASSERTNVSQTIGFYAVLYWNFQVAVTLAILNVNLFWEFKDGFKGQESQQSDANV